MALEADTTDKKPNAAYDRSSLPRARSSLELLSETATIIESTEASASVPRDPTPPPSMLMADSPASARITPPTANSYLPVVAETLQLPEMVSMTNKAKQALHPRKEMVAVQHIHYDNTNGNLNNAHLYLPTFAPPQELYSRNSSRTSTTTTTLTTSGGGGVGVTTLASTGSSSFALPTDDPVHEKLWLRQQVAVRDATIATLQTQVHQLQQEIRQLRQLPTGKISQIPVEDMLHLMRTYGSEVSDMAMPPRKSCVQKASVVRQFRRWNPRFLDWFEHVNGQWVPKLGREGELKRRQRARQEASVARRVKSKQTHGHSLFVSDDCGTSSDNNSSSNSTK